ncbi:MAG: hypothetical protein U0103_16640 [Candidatus Obscuribacterales bacterium]
MLTSSIAHTVSAAFAQAFAASANVQTVLFEQKIRWEPDFGSTNQTVFDLGDSASGASDQQIFFPQGESTIAFVLIALGVVFGIAIGFFLSHLMVNRKVVLAGALTIGYFAVLGFVTVSLGVAASFWIGLATVGGYFWARNIVSRHTTAVK